MLASCGTCRLVVHPIGGVRVAPDLHVLGEFLVADGATLLQKRFNLLQYQRVALDGGGVMRFFEPETAPDVLRFDGMRESTETLPQLSDLSIEPLANHLSAWATSSAEILFAHGHSKCAEHFQKVFVWYGSK